jgi:hypothetical protein
VTAWTKEVELPRLRRSIDAGRPVVLGLVAARDLAEVARNRQVVAYGYDQDGAGAVRVQVYDSHHPDEEVVLSTDPGNPQVDSSAPGGPWRGLFVQDYVTERPPYLDLGTAKGIWVNSWTPTLGGNFVAQFTARNYGDYRARLAELRLAVRGPAGENLDRFLGGDGDSTPLEPGEERAVFKASDGFGTVPGGYLVAAGYLSEDGRWVAIPPCEPGAVDQVGVTVVPRLHRTLVTVAFTEVTVEDADALGGRLQLRLAVGDLVARWPEVGLAEVEQGKALEVGCRFELEVEPDAVVELSVAGSGDQGRPAGVVREPYFALVDWGSGAHAYRSRVPDGPDPDLPGPRAAPGAYTIAFRVDATPLDG